ncbi:MAG: phosphopyruvate hydratase [Planctomycetota bacterium]|nr:MAG: phosphopyruvate hydratase [Planctomycetota bacterium]
MARIASVHAREVLDSRGWPTVEVDVRCDDGALGRAIVPSGASTGAAEAHELRDGDVSRYDGRGVLRAVASVNGEIAATISGLNVVDQAAIDRRLIALDGTPNKHRLGANAILGASLAIAHAAAAAQRVPLWKHLNRLAAEAFVPLSPPTPRMPTPMTNMISGGAHAGENIDFQDILIMPTGAGPMSERLESIARVYRRLADLLETADLEGRLVGDEGGFGPRLESNESAIEFVASAIKEAGFTFDQMQIALDVAATQLYNCRNKNYRLMQFVKIVMPSEKLAEFYARLIARFPLASVEDPFAEDDWAAWSEFTAKHGNKLQIVGDDLIVTNPGRLKRVIAERAANAVLIKLNQIGTLTETLETIRLARQAGFRTIVSARSGETEDTTIADLAVATAADQIKIGSIVRSERLAKYNRLLRIEEELSAC